MEIGYFATVWASLMVRRRWSVIRPLPLLLILIIVLGLLSIIPIRWVRRQVVTELLILRRLVIMLLNMRISVMKRL